MGHMNYKRVSKRIIEELKSTIEVARVTSLMGALNTLLGKIDIQIMVHNGHIEHNWIKKQLMKKHTIMNEYFSKTCMDIEEKDKYIIPMQDNEYKDCIWICWWQGLEKAPDIVKSCINSIKKHAGNHKVVIITDDNCSDFITFPNWIEDKRRAGVISKTHISDLLRLSLLARYGGMWLDSTFFCTDDLEEYFTSPVWSIKRPDYRHTSVACGNFANYSFGCNSDNRKVFATLLDYLLQYWKTHDYMVDYLFLDYLIVQAQQNSKEVADAFGEIAPNNPECDELLKVLENPFDEQLWDKLTKDTRLFKLTWKASFSKEVNGRQTFYGKLLEGSLN